MIYQYSISIYKRRIKIRVFHVLVVIFILMMYACMQEFDTKADIEAIRKVGDTISKSLNENNMDLLMGLYTEDAILMPQGQPICIGKEAILKRNEYMKEISYNVTSPSDEIKVFGDWAFRRGTFKGTWKLKSGGEWMTVNNQGIQILHKQLDGSWKITHNIFNNN